MSIARASRLTCVLPMALAAFFASPSFADDKEAIVELDAPWSLEGTWTGVAADDAEGAIYALDSEGKCVELDPLGQVRREFILEHAGGSVLRFADWGGNEGRALLAFTTWATELRAYDAEGAPLWTAAAGVDDVWGTNLGGEKPAAVIVGYNGGTGLHVLDQKGEVRWKSEEIGNVWHVCAGDVWGDGTTQVVSTSAKGQVHVFSSDGKKRKNLNAGVYANMVRVGKLSDKDKSATIFAGGSVLTASGNGNVMLVALSGEGKKKWSLKLPAGGAQHIDALALSGKWLAVGMRGGLVHVVDAEKGAVVDSVEDQGMSPEVAWLTRKDAEGGKEPQTPLLLVATRSSLNAYGLRSK